MSDAELHDLILDRLSRLDAKIDQLVEVGATNRTRIALLEQWRVYISVGFGIVASFATGLLQEVFKRAIGSGGN